MPTTLPTELRCNHLANPLGLDDPAPRLSWRLETDGRRGARQTGYRVLVSTAEGAAPDLWDSGRVASDATAQVAYRGKPLSSGRRAWWRVQAWDERGRRSESGSAFWEAGLLDRGDWTGSWIGTSLTGGPESGIPSPHLRTIFNVGRRIASARLYATALGLYEFHINGRRVGTDVFSPGWTDYATRVQYDVYDVTRLLRRGANAAGAILGDGWYCGHVGWLPRAYYGDRPRLLAQVVITFTDGSTQTIATGDSWRTAFGPIVDNDLINGEAYDARKEMPGWDTADFDDSSWQPAEIFPSPAIAISPHIGPPVRATQELRPLGPPKRIETWQTPIWIYDMGQNMVGRVQLKVRGAAGQVVRLRFAEVLSPDGNIYTDNLRAARQTDHYTLRGDPAGETWESQFTFHGFRYVEIYGPTADPVPGAITGIVLHSDTPRTGEFSCSDPLVNQLQSNIDWGQRGNFLEVPTDCPQRNERLGWMGDAQVFCRTAAWNRDVIGFFNKWQRDIADAQTEAGAMPSVAPHVGGPFRDGGPAWADAAVICPWTMYLCYGDTALLRTHFESLKRYIGFLEKQSIGLIRSHPDAKGWLGYGDWLALDGSGKVEGGTPKDLIGTAFFVHSTRLVGRIARILGDSAAAARCDRLVARVVRAYRRRFLTGDGLVAALTQTGYVLTLHFDLAPEALRPRLLAELVRDIELRGNKLSTGFVSTAYVSDVLSRAGRIDVAYKLLHQKQWPSWLYAVTQGATTIWERWDGWTHDRGFQDKGMNSFNHYAYGAIGAWLYTTVAGIDVDPEKPAYKHILLAPRPGGEITSARGSLQSIHGGILSSWKLRGGRLEWEVVVPPNTTATASFPPAAKGAAASVTEGGRPLARSRGVTRVRRSGGSVVCELAAGRYRFTAKGMA